MTARRLTSDERRLWGAVMATVKPLRALAIDADTKQHALPPTNPHPSGATRLPPFPMGRGNGAAEGGRKGEGDLRVSSRHQSNTLDGGWDKRLSRGLVAADASIDLHGHTLASAHAILDAGLARSIARGDRLLLLVTGKPPRPESERPHARGAIRAAVADWLAASRHADRIAAVRGAHPRHGGAGALYIVLRRAKTPA